jgi:hypothetical protein
MVQVVGLGRFAVWCVATALSAGLVWLGLTPVLRAAVPDRVETGTAADLQRSVRVGIGSGPSLSPSPSSSSSTVDGWTVVTESDGSTSYVRRFTVDGGRTTIRMTPGRVELVSATPEPGYAMETLQPSPDRVVVRFYTPGELFTIDAIWFEGRPYAEVTRND